MKVIEVKGNKKGALSEAIEEAVILWLEKTWRKLLIYKLIKNYMKFNFIKFRFNFTVLHKSIKMVAQALKNPK